MAEIVTVPRLSRIAVPVQVFTPTANLTSITRCHPLHSTHLVSRISTLPPIIHPIDPFHVVHLPSSSLSSFRQSRMGTRPLRRIAG